MPRSILHGPKNWLRIFAAEATANRTGMPPKEPSSALSASPCLGFRSLRIGASSSQELIRRSVESCLFGTLWLTTSGMRNLRFIVPIVRCLRSLRPPQIVPANRNSHPMSKTSSTSMTSESRLRSFRREPSRGGGARPSTRTRSC